MTDIVLDPLQIVDGTADGGAAVKAPSTAAAATDPALVTAFSPNSPLPAGTNTIGSVNLNGLTFPFYVVGEQAAGAAVTENPVLMAGSDGSFVRTIATDDLGNQFFASPMESSSYPDPSGYTEGTAQPMVDAYGNVMVRGTVLTDELSFRDDFTGTALTTSLTGTVTFTAGSTNVTGVGTSFTSQVVNGQYVKKSADAESAYAQVASVNSPTSITLATPYAGATSGAASVVSNWQSSTPTGGAIAVASSVVTLTAGTTASVTGSLRALGDFLPYSFIATAAVSQRIANQTLWMGFQDAVGAPIQQATVQFTGTTNTQVNFVTSFSALASEIQTTTVTLPSGGVTSGYHTYRIDLSANQATLFIDGVKVAVNTQRLPQPYRVLYITAGYTNAATAPASSTAFSIDTIFFENVDRLQIDNDFAGEPIVVTGQDATGSAVLAAVNAAVTANTAGCNTVTFNVVGAYAATMLYEATNGDGTWTNIQAWLPDSQTYTSYVNSSNDLAIVQCGGFTQVRMRMTAYTSGAPTITWNAAVGENVRQVYQGGRWTATPVNATGGALWVQDHATMTPGTQSGQPVMGQSSNVGRIVKVSRLGHVNPAAQTILAADAVEGSTINSWLWSTQTNTQTIAQASGLLTLNASATLTAATYAILVNNRQFQILNQAPVSCSFRALVTANTNGVVEFGFGAASGLGVNPIIANGAFFRFSGTMQATLVLASGGVVVTVASSTLSATSYYLFVVALQDNGAQFTVEDANGVPIIDTFVPLGLTTPDKSGLTHVPTFARTYVTGTAATVASRVSISSHQVFLLELFANKPWPEQLAGAGRQANNNPTTFTQALQLATTFAPTATTPTNAAVAFAALGGEFSLNMTASSENYLGVFGYQVPAPYTLYITDVVLPPPAVTTAFGATATVQEWALMAASSTNPSSATGLRYPLGLFTAASNAALGTLLSGGPLVHRYTTPLVVLPGQYLLVLMKNILGAATGVYRGVISINGYYE